jgi:surface polysaccharide O-acyltransferase-like enzyme
LYFRSEKGKIIISKIADFLEKKGAIYLLIIPMIFVQILLRDKFSGFHNLVDDMANFALFFLFFVCGFIICSDDRLWASIEKQRRISLILALVFFSTSFSERQYFGGVLGYHLYWIVQTGVSWFWVLSIIGYGRRYLNFKTKFLGYANEGIYPFYILHQTVLIVLAFYVIRWDTSISIKYFALSLSTLLICVLVYDFVIKRNNFVRVLFGMRYIKKNTPV